MSDRAKVYFDTNVFIVAYENVGARSDHAWWLLDALEAGEIIGGTSEITLAELLVKPIEEGADALAAAYQAVIAPASGFMVSPVDRPLLVAAAGIRASRKSIKLPDAIHIATAAALGCNYFVSGDRRLHLPTGMTQLLISPFTLDDILQARP